MKQQAKKVPTPPALLEKRQPSKGSPKPSVPKKEKKQASAVQPDVAKTPRDKYLKKGVRGVLVNLDLDTADAFIKIAKAQGSNPTAKARELIETFLASQNSSNVE
jgi:hypothetical protein